MESVPSSTTTKQKKGFQRVWDRIKAAMSIISLPSQPKDLQEASSGHIQKKEESAAMISTPLSAEPQTVSKTAPSQPTAQSGNGPDTTATTQDQDIVADRPNVIDVQQPQKEETPRQHHRIEPLPFAVDAIEVDDAEDAEEDVPMPTSQAKKQILSDKHSLDNARAVFAQYNLPLDVSDWKSSSRHATDRVEKRPRMRVRHTCHECDKVFGREKVCAHCGHERCPYCHRYPPKRASDKQRREKKIRPARAPPPSNTSYACHDCKTSFDIGDQSCPNCQHVICDRCLKESMLPSLPSHEPYSLTTVS